MSACVAMNAGAMIADVAGGLHVQPAVEQLRLQLAPRTPGALPGLISMPASRP